MVSVVLHCLSENDCLQVYAPNDPEFWQGAFSYWSSSIFIFPAIFPISSKAIWYHIVWIELTKLSGHSADKKYIKPSIDQLFF